MADTATSTEAACPHPEKRGRYRTQAFADAVARTQAELSGRPIRAYRCTCGLYRLTSSKQHRNRPGRADMNTANGAGTLAPESVLAWSSEPPVETPEELLERGRYGSTRAQELAAHIDRLLGDLSDLLELDAARLEKERRAAELRAEIAARAAELEALEADLTGPEPGQPNPAAGRAGASTAEIRAWLNANGHPCSERGRLSTRQVAAYENAHRDGE